MIDDCAAEDGYRRADYCEVSLSASVEGDGIGLVAQRDANQVLVCTGEDSIIRVGWICVGKTRPVVKIALQHAVHIKTQALITVREVVMATLMPIQAGRRHHAEIRKLVGKQALTVP
jgi:hypothetical protein